ncbi:hypothetical protein [Devosia sp. XK-2]|uniref:hypothetical protein n=1 Tax=Devosia sp. XK-2 TaxID=3126689 RepID=UPI0030D52221
MTTPGAYIVRPGKARLALIVAVGPMVGIIFALVLPVIVGMQVLFGWSYSIWVSLWGAAGALLSGAYLLGIVPALVGAFVYRWVSPVIGSVWQHVGACLAIGALCGGLGAQLPIALFSEKFFMFEPTAGFLSALGGALALPILAMPYSRKR